MYTVWYLPVADTLGAMFPWIVKNERGVVLRLANRAGCWRHPETYPRIALDWTPTWEPLDLQATSYVTWRLGLPHASKPDHVESIEIAIASDAILRAQELFRFTGGKRAVVPIRPGESVRTQRWWKIQRSGSNPKREETDGKGS